MSRSSPASDFYADRKGGNDLKLDSAYTVHDEHKSKGIMAAINQVCLQPSSITTRLKKGFREVPAVSEAHIKKGNISLSWFASALIKLKLSF